MVLNKLFDPKNITPDVESEDKEELFEEMVDLLVSNDDSLDREEVLVALREREAKLSTGIKKGIALPHARIEGLKEPKGVIGISRKGVDYDALDGNPVYIIFMVLSTTEDYTLHLKILNRLNILLLNPNFLEEIFPLNSPTEIYNIICKYEEMAVGAI